MESLGSLLGSSNIGPVGLLTVAVLLIMFGGLIPRWQYRSMLEEKDKQIREHREDKIRQQETIGELSNQNTLLIGKVELSLHIAESIKKLGEEARS